MCVYLNIYTHNTYTLFNICGLIQFHLSKCQNSLVINIKSINIFVNIYKKNKKKYIL